jgi:hypothetical protein
MQSLCFLNVNYSDIKVITHMRHRASLFRLKLQTPSHLSSAGEAQRQARASIITCRFYGGGEAEKSLSKMNIPC